MTDKPTATQLDSARRWAATMAARVWQLEAAIRRHRQALRTPTDTDLRLHALLDQHDPPDHPEGRPVDPGDLDAVWNAIRRHPITDETCWLVGVAATLHVELTSALEREQHAWDRTTELELRLAAHLDPEDVA